MKSYNTEQRAMLTGFLKDNNESALSAEEIAEGLKEKYKEEAPGKSTVYRLLSRLCEEGSVKRFSSECGTKLYQLSKGKDCKNHLHLKCLGCGKIVHMSHSVTEEILKDVVSENGFDIDKEQTVIYGVCAKCREKEH